MKQWIIYTNCNILHAPIVEEEDEGGSLFSSWINKELIGSCVENFPTCNTDQELGDLKFHFLKLLYYAATV